MVGVHCSNSGTFMDGTYFFFFFFCSNPHYYKFLQLRNTISIGPSKVQKLSFLPLVYKPKFFFPIYTLIGLSFLSLIFAILFFGLTASAPSGTPTSPRKIFSLLCFFLWSIECYINIIICSPLNIIIWYDKLFSLWTFLYDIITFNYYRYLASTSKIIISDSGC